jgi:site-specific DNA-methyltransferase (adenine-specific)
LAACRFAVLETGGAAAVVSRKDLALKRIVYRGETYQCPYADLLRPLSSDEYEALRASIKERGGVTVPVVIDNNNNVIDGQHRLRIAAALDVHCPFTELRATEESKRELAISLNIYRRQSSKEDVRNAVAQLLQNDPGQSDRTIAEKTKVDHKTVGAARRKLESTGEIPQLKTRTGLDGKKRKPATSAKPSPVADEPISDARHFLSLGIDPETIEYIAREMRRERGWDGLRPCSADTELGSVMKLLAVALNRWWLHLFKERRKSCTASDRDREVAVQLIASIEDLKDGIASEIIENSVLGVAANG